jgi:hypothetical protein
MLGPATAGADAPDGSFVSPNADRVEDIIAQAVQHVRNVRPWRGCGKGGLKGVVVVGGSE